MSSEDKPLEIQLVSSSSVCAGMATAYLCRSIAHRAGTYAPGIHERVFSSLNELRFGADVDTVSGWFRQATDELFGLGYRLCARRVAFRTPIIEKWVAGGDGFRAALLTTDAQALHNGKVDAEAAHAVGLVLPRNSKKKSAILELVDPWPGVEHRRPADGKLEAAHRGRKYGTVLVFWSGYS